MANTDRPWGLRPLYMEEAERTAMLFPITNNYGTNLFLYDPVVGVTSGGRIERATAGYGNMILGSILGIYKQATPKTLRMERQIPCQYYEASPGTANEYFALVACCPHLVFIMQEDGDTTPLTVDEVWENCDLVFTHGGNATTGISGCELDSTAHATDALYQMKLLQPYYDYWDVDAGAYNTIGAYCKWLVKINKHQLGTYMAGV